MIKDYFLQNTPLILILAAFAISLFITVFLDKRTIRRMYILIGVIFLLSIIVFIEFYFAEAGTYRLSRIVLMTIRYSATPFVIALLLYSLDNRQKWYIFIPAIILSVIDFISIKTGIVFSVDENNVFKRGVLGYLPFIIAGFYAVFLIYMLIKRSNKHMMEIVPIGFLAIALTLSLIMPFLFGKAFSKIYCTLMAIALFVYYVFLILELTKKDALTGLLNRQALYSDLTNDYEEITAIISIDMDGLKTLNDTYGHAAGDEALVKIAHCFNRALRKKRFCYRIGGDEFVIVCWKTSEDEVKTLIKNINKYVGETKYHCSIGYCYNEDKIKSMDEMIRVSDEMMYAEKAKYYTAKGMDRRK